MDKISDLTATLGDIPVETSERIVQQKSRDFYWYSPVLKARLDPMRAELVVSPRNEEEVMRTLAACARLQIPVTARGAGTGNYGQAVPLAGGVMLNLATMNRVLSIAPGSVVAEPGAVLHDIDLATRADSGQELRMHPSTSKLATLGGFIAGGSGGVGSIRWGGLRAQGNILRVRIATMEAEPKPIELTGTEIEQINHAYGTNGIITEIEMPLTAAYDWVDVLLCFDDWASALHFGFEAAHQDGLLLKELGAIEAPVPFDYFLRHKPFLAREDHVVIAMVAPQSMAAFADYAESKSARLVMRSDQLAAEQLKRLPPVYELGWNHTTLRALRVDPSITYLQVGYPPPDAIERVLKMSALFGDEVPGHVEFTRYDGRINISGLPLVRFTSEARLDQIVQLHESHACPVYNPHRFTLEEGNCGKAIDSQLAFKRRTDPMGLLNPGKMIAWDAPDFDFTAGEMYEYSVNRQDPP